MKMIRTSEAFANRDYEGEAVGDCGHWHEGVAVQKTCKWEPLYGKAAVMATGACEKISNKPRKMLRCLFDTYRVFPSTGPTRGSNAAKHARKKRFIGSTRKPSVTQSGGGGKSGTKTNDDFAETRTTYCGRLCEPLK